MTKPKDTKSSLFAGGQLLPETSPEEYQKAAREDLDVTFDDARIADMRTQAVARAEAGLADWERRVPRIADRSGWWRVTVKEMRARRDVKAGEMVTAKDVERDEPPTKFADIRAQFAKELSAYYGRVPTDAEVAQWQKNRVSVPYKFRYDAVLPITDGTWPDSLGEIRGSFERVDAPSGPVWPGSLADLQSQPGVRSARNDGPGRVVVMLKRDASDAEWRGLRDWNDEHMGAGSVMMLEREPPTLEGYVKEQMADVPAGWNAEMWRARVLGMLEQTSDRSALPGERLRLMAEYVTRVRRGASSEMVAGLSSYVPATPRWWKGETPPRPERMGLKRGRGTR